MDNPLRTDGLANVCTEVHASMLHEASLAQRSILLAQHRADTADVTRRDRVIVAVNDRDTPLAQKTSPTTSPRRCERHWPSRHATAIGVCFLGYMQ